ncbi:MAG: type II toxin-antitoxin system VapC family toxin [Phycisphaerae bacterium]|nr:type II toxin-antitoxin system VapC family toxin [Gemmatimonadaceae bacterium]
MIFVDANIPMYLVGAPHPNKETARLLIERCIADRERLVTDAEVFQEILHRYVAINRLDAIKPAFKALLGVIDEVYPVELRDTVLASKLVAEYAPWSARDALHVAVMQRYAVRRILTFDAGFARVRWVERVRE